MQGSGELLLSRILEELNSLSRENKEVLQKLYENNVLDTTQSMDIKGIQEKLKQVINRIDDLESRMVSIEKSRTEISGFAKYTKLIWAILMAITAYIIKLGLK